jgi:hypothetical protein
MTSDPDTAVLVLRADRCGERRDLPPQTAGTAGSTRMIVGMTPDRGHSRDHGDFLRRALYVRQGSV